MKIKTLTLLLGSVSLASVFALTSCGSNDLKSVAFASYSNEISKEAFFEKASSIDIKDNLDGYTLNAYTGKKIEYTGDVKKSLVSIEEDTTKLNKNDNKYYFSYRRYNEINEENSSSVSEINSEKQYQKNVQEFDYINIIDKEYKKSSFDFDNYSYVRLQSYMQHSEAYNYANYEDVKFYCDNDIYTAVYNKSDTQEENENNYSHSLSSNVEVIFQFSLSEAQFFVKSKVVYDSKSNTTIDGKKVSINQNREYYTDVNVEFVAPTIDTIDLAKYTETFNMYY